MILGVREVEISSVEQLGSRCTPLSSLRPSVMSSQWRQREPSGQRASNRLHTHPIVAPEGRQPGRPGGGALEVARPICAPAGMLAGLVHISAAFVESTPGEADMKHLGYLI